MFKFINKFFHSKKDFAPSTNDAPAIKHHSDPLDFVSRQRGWDTSQLKLNPIQRSITDFPLYRAPVMKTGDATDAADTDTDGVKHGSAMDDGQGEPIASPMQYTIPEGLQNWYMSQSFLGYQTLAIMAQHWLVDKACSMAGDDAIRNGWTIRGDSGDEITGETYDLIHSYDKKFHIKANLSELNRFNNIFGIRIAIFDVKSDDPDYYEKPFNMDGVTEGSYYGISQVDPQWIMPMMTAESTSDPSTQHFYEPDYWIISGKKYHRSHLIVARGPQTADILKPTYIFGGVSLVQRIYERVYAAERTANEAPLLAMNKRTTAIHVDLDKVAANELSFMQRLMIWVKYRDNHAVKVLGKEETMDQYDTSLADFDNVIMSQYQLVAAIAKVPATKLLGTPPKGFNATGEFEMISYHEELESIQEHMMTPMLDRHYLLLGKSLALKTNIHSDWNPVDSITTVQKSELNLKKAETDIHYITAGVISPDEARNRLRQDRYANYSTITEEEANTTPGLSPENITQFEEAGAEITKGEAAVLKSQAAVSNVAAGKNPTGTMKRGMGGVEGALPEPATDRPAGEPPVSPYVPGTPPRTYREPGIVPGDHGPSFNQTQIATLLYALLEKLADTNDTFLPEGQLPDTNSSHSYRSSTPSVQRSLIPSVAGMQEVSQPTDAYKLPKMKYNGMTLAVESPRGSIRQGINLDGTRWAAKMSHHYGYIKGVQGADGNELDCFIGPDLSAKSVYVINQNDPNTGEFDEHKVMFGFSSPEAAKDAYHDSFNTGWQGFDSMVSTSMDQFRQWASQGPLTNPLSAEQIQNVGSAPATA